MGLVVVGVHFGALEVVDLDATGFEGDVVKAKCSCGMLTTVPASKLLDGSAASCAWRRPSPEYLRWMSQQTEK